MFQSTNIKFTEWIQVVKILLGNDKSNTNTISYHLEQITNPTIVQKTKSRINLQKVKRHS